MNKLIAKGFNLIELLVCLAIVSILSGAAYYGYQHYLTKNYRMDAINHLLKLQLSEEQYYLQHQQYASLQELTGNQQLVIADGKYIITTPIANHSDYILQAQAKGKQAGDQENNVSCEILIVEINDAEEIRSPESCWK